MDQYDGYNNIRSFFSNWLKLWYFWNKTRWARSRVCKPKLRKGFLQCCLNCWYLAVMHATLEKLDCKFLKELNFIIIFRTMTNGSLLIVKTQLSSWIWPFRLTLRPVSEVLNIGCEAVSIFICEATQHVRANKELSILYFIFYII